MNLEKFEKAKVLITEIESFKVLQQELKMFDPKDSIDDSFLMMLRGYPEFLQVCVSSLKLYADIQEKRLETEFKEL